MLQRAAPAHFVADLRRYHEMFAACGAITRDSDGWQGIDTTKAPSDAVDAYGRLLRVGYSKGWL
jgi:hypothetical protein